VLEPIGANLVCLDGDWVSWEQLAAEAGSRFPVPVQDDCAFVAESDCDAFRAVAMMTNRRGSSLLLPIERLDEAAGALLAENGLRTVRAVAGSAPRPEAEDVRGRGKILLLTSGSTGRPKLVAHMWETLCTYQRSRRSGARTWMVPYIPGSYAWYQMVTLGLFLPDQKLVPVQPAQMTESFDLAEEAGADAISSTPTFWRLALLSVPEERLSAIRFAQISLGGEVVDQAILDRLRSLYPRAAITHIYASTEAGASIVVNDGRAGFPAKWLEESSTSTIELRIREGRLFVRSPYTHCAAVGSAAQWIDTNDRVELRDGRVQFLGRATSDMINVGGSKAYPADIEAVILSHPHVRWCRVSARKAPMVGFLPVADVLPTSGGSAGNLEQELSQYCRSRLPDYAVPRFWNFVDRIPVSAATKTELA
jgi:acyl-CoA synthetase (AMP-forming)/AMP-acid ligase II